MGNLRGPDARKTWNVVAQKPVHPAEEAQRKEALARIAENMPGTLGYQALVKPDPMAKLKKESAKGRMSKAELQHRRDQSIEKAELGATAAKSQRHERELKEYRERYQADPKEWPWTPQMRENLDLRKVWENHNRPIQERRETQMALALHQKYEKELSRYAVVYDSDTYRDRIWPIQGVDPNNKRLVRMIQDHNLKVTEAQEWQRRQTVFASKPAPTYSIYDWEAEKARQRQVREQKYQRERLEKLAHIRRTEVRSRELNRAYYVVRKVKPIPGKVD